MRVALKLVGALLLLLVLIRTVEGALTVSRESARLEADVQRDNRQMQRVLGKTARAAWVDRGEAEVIEQIERLNTPGHPLQIDWISRDRGDDALERRLDDAEMDQLASGQVVEHRLRNEDGQMVRHAYVPIEGAEDAGAIRLVERLAERSRYRDNAVVRELVAGTVVVLLGGGVIVLLGVTVIGRPLDRLQARIDRIGEGDLESRLSLGTRDELSNLAEGLNRMCERLSASQQAEREATQQKIAAVEQVRHAERLTTIGRLASGVAHELGTPLNVVIGRAQMIRDDPAVPDKPRGYAELIRSQGERMSDIIRRLLNFARHHPQKRVPTDLNQSIEQARSLIANLGYKGQVRVVKVHRAEPLQACADPGQVQQVLLNLIENALQSMPEDGEVVVESQSVQAHPPEGSGLTACEAGYIRLSVSDRGEGIDPAHLREVFDPFFTTKEVGEGSGLGLSIVYGIVRDHEGWIDVSSEPGRGSRFSVYLPREEVR